MNGLAVTVCAIVRVVDGFRGGRVHFEIVVDVGVRLNDLTSHAVAVAILCCGHLCEQF